MPLSVMFNRNCITQIKQLSKVAFSESKFRTVCASYSQQTRADHKDTSNEDFRVLDLKPKKNVTVRRRISKAEVMLPRTNVMPIDQDWTSVWPGPRSFHPASVPLPLRQGYNQKGAPPGKFGNAELMKIPNFLHLTPPAVKKHCEALRKFCTAWPEGLETEEKCEKAFPLEVITTDYCHSSPDIRDPLARIVTIKLKLSQIPLNAHAKDKFLRLVGERYNPESDVLTIVTDCCPVKQQNYDYAIYLLMALFHESWRVEPWESEKTLEDMEYYDWETNKSKSNILGIIAWAKEHKSVNATSENIEQELKEYKEAVSELVNKGESEYTLNQYKEKVKKLLFLSNPAEGASV